MGEPRDDSPLLPEEYKPHQDNPLPEEINPIDEDEQHARFMIGFVYTNDYLYVYLQELLQETENSSDSNTRLIFYTAEELWRRDYTPEKPLVVIAFCHLMSLKVYDFPQMPNKSENYEHVMEYINILLMISVTRTPPQFPARLPTAM